MMLHMTSSTSTRMTFLPKTLLACTLLLASARFVLTEAQTATESSTTPYIAQIRMLVEADAVTEYQRTHPAATHQTIRDSIYNLFLEITDIYDNFDGAGTSLHFEILDIEFISNNVITNKDAKNRVRDTSTVLAFAQWIETNWKNKPYDIGFLLTGADLINFFGSSSTVGYSQADAVCLKGVAVAEYNGTEIDSLVIAHEIGHVMGIIHDGWSGRGCSMYSKNLWDATLHLESRNHFYFSDCSSQMLKESLAKETHDCLTDGSLNNTVKGKSIGFRNDPDSWCQLQYGKKAYFSRITHASYGDDLCVQLTCIAGNGDKKLTLTPQGMSCGKSSRCIKGKCVVRPDGNPSLPYTCPFGEARKTETGREYCSLIAPDQCNTYGEECCYSCNTKNPALTETADDVCRGLFGPQSVMDRSAYTSYGKAFCKKLQCLVVQTNGSVTVQGYKAPDGLRCGAKQRCNDNFCILGWNKGDDIPVDCPYGDQPWVGDVTKTCSQLIKENGCQGLENTCCASCSKKITLVKN